MYRMTKTENTLRLHLNTRDALPSVDGVNNANNGWVKFDLKKAGLKARPNSKLSVALVKACIPPTTSAFGSEYREMPILGFKIENASPAPDAPAVENVELKLTNQYFYNSDRNLANWKWNSTAQLTTWTKNIDYQTDVDGIVRVLNDMYNTQYQSGDEDPFNIDPVTKRFGVSESYVGTISFYNKYFQKDKPEYNPSAARLYEWLGIDTTKNHAFDTLTKFGSLGTGVMRRAPHQATTYQCPLYVFTNLELNSVSSLDKGSHTNVLSSIPINMGVRVGSNQTDTSILANPEEPAHDPDEEDHISWVGVRTRNLVDSDAPWTWGGAYINTDKAIIGACLMGDMVTQSAPAPALYSAMFSGIDAVCGDPQNTDQVIFFKDTSFYYFNLDGTKVSGPHDIPTHFAQTTTQVLNVVRNNYDNSTDLAGQLLVYETNGMMTRYTVSGSGVFTCDDPTSGFWRGNEAWKLHDAATLEHLTGNGALVFKGSQFWESHDADGNFTGWVTYGGAGQAFEGLPHDLDGCFTHKPTNKVYCFKDDKVYDINYDKSTNPHTFTINSTNNFGGATVPAVPAKINFDGANDYVEIDDLDDRILNWTKSWSIGITAPEVHNPIDASKRTVVRRGDNAILITKGSGNAGFYMSAVDGIHDPTNNQGMSWGHGVNTWSGLTNTSQKWLFTYNHTTGKLRWYIDDCLKGTIQLTATEMTIGVTASTPLQVGRAMGGYYGGTFWDGHFDNLLLVNSNLVDGSQQITDYFADDNFNSHEYANLITNYFKLGEDSYPDITDEVGSASGEHKDGTSGDFLDMNNNPMPSNAATPPTIPPNYSFGVYPDADPALWDIVLIYEPTVYANTRFYTYRINPSDPRQAYWTSSWDGNFTNGDPATIGQVEWEIETQGANWYQFSGLGNTLDSLLTSNTESMIDKFNYNVEASHKLIDADTVTDMEFYLSDITGQQRGTSENVYYEIEFKEVFDH